MMSCEFVEGRRKQVVGTRAPQGLAHPNHGTYVSKKEYARLSETSTDRHPIRDQPAAAKAARALSIIIMNITSWNSKIYRNVSSLNHDVILSNNIVSYSATKLRSQRAIP